MATTMSEYISSTDELLVDSPDDPEWEGTAAAYDVTVDEERDELVLESLKDDFCGRMLGVSLDDTDLGEMTRGIVEMRALQDEIGARWEFQVETFPPYNPTIPTHLEYFYDDDRNCVGGRVSTEVDGSLYGFETVTNVDDRKNEPSDILEHQFERQLKALSECIWEDFVVSNVTLDEE